MSLDRDKAEQVIRSQVAEPLDLQIERAAYGIHDIISEDVARAFRIHASERGFEYRASSMIALAAVGRARNPGGEGSSVFRGLCSRWRPG